VLIGGILEPRAAGGGGSVIARGTSQHHDYSGSIWILKQSARSRKINKSLQPPIDTRENK
jgi:hypothetical protein